LPYANPYADPKLFNLAQPEAHRIWFQHVYGPHASAIWGWLAVVIVVAPTVCTYALVVVAALARREACPVMVAVIGGTGETGSVVVGTLLSPGRSLDQPHHADGEARAGRRTRFRDVDHVVGGSREEH
jgi:hypothetical protein